MRKDEVWFLVAVVLLGMLLLRESRDGVLTSLDLMYRDWQIANGQWGSGEKPALTLVEINESSFEVQKEWPWSPLDHALFLKAVTRFKPALVGIQPVLSWESAPPAQEKILYDQALRTSKLLLGVELRRVRDPDEEPPSLPIIQHVTGDVSHLHEFAGYENQPAEDLRLTAQLGVTNLGYPEGTTQRSLPLVYRYRGDVVPSFALHAVVQWLKLSVRDVELEAGSRLVVGEDLEIPVNERGELLVNFALLSKVARLGYDDLLLSVEQLEADREPHKPLDVLNDRVVVFGRTDPDSRTVRLPGTRRCSPVQMTCAAIATLQLRAFVRRAPVTVDIVLLVALSAVAFIAQRRRRKFIAMTGLLTLIGYPLVSLAFFAATAQWLPFVLPFGLLLFALCARLLDRKPGASASKDPARNG